MGKKKTPPAWCALPYPSVELLRLLLLLLLMLLLLERSSEVELQLAGRESEKRRQLLAHIARVQVARATCEGSLVEDRFSFFAAFL